MALPDAEAVRVFGKKLKRVNIEGGNNIDFVVNNRRIQVKWIRIRKIIQP